MTQVSYSGSGITALKIDQIGSGQGLQVGDTDVDFANGQVHLAGIGSNTKIGSFRGLITKNNDKLSVKSLVFKAKTKCLLTIDDSVFVYETLGEYLTFNHIDITTMRIHRDTTGQNPDVFDWQFIASSDPEYKFTIQKSNRDSETEVLFPSLSRAVNPYTQNVNLRGAKRIILQGASPASAETGLATVTLEIFDPASGVWNNLVPNQDIFTIAQGQNKEIEIGDTISKSPVQSQYGYISAPVANGSPPGTNQTLSGTNSTSNGVSTLGSSVGHVLPSGDNILRAKVVVSANSLTFSLSIIKVFD